MSRRTTSVVTDGRADVLRSASTKPCSLRGSAPGRAQQGGCMASQMGDDVSASRARSPGPHRPRPGPCRRYRQLRPACNLRYHADNDPAFRPVVPHAPMRYRAAHRPMTRDKQEELWPELVTGRVKAAVRATSCLASPGRRQADMPCRTITLPASPRRPRSTDAVPARNLVRRGHRVTGVARCGLGYGTATGNRDGCIRCIRPAR